MNPFRIIGESAAMCRLRDLIEVAASCNEPVLIVGETGTGKELVARGVHARSRRAVAALSIVHCAAFAPEMIAAELFGHVAGTFTGASYNRDGRLTAAAGSSIFLDEISATSIELQVALLRAVEYGEVQPVGADGPARSIDVRYIAASNTSLRCLRDGRGGLRLDLLYRLAGIVIEVPPLRERPEDIPALNQHFLDEAHQEYGRRKRLSARVLNKLVRGHFSGNARELRQTIRRAYVACEGEVIRLHHLHDPFGGLSANALERRPEVLDEAHGTLPCTESRFSLPTATRRWLVSVLAHAEGNLSEAARLPEIPRSTLQHHLVKHKINVDGFRSAAVLATAPTVTPSREATPLNSEHSG